ncbi:MAG TPA: zf-HC2 domain-containing protein [Bryobacteraceae bacterium]|nr:zf-HC2 domain-containing protein [Bryobacteraceae bacterium]
MNCKKWESDIALYAGGDLPDGHLQPVEQHLAGCADCRALVEDLRTGQALLAALRDEPLDDAMVARVRYRVLSQVSAPRQVPVYWKLALAAALILAVALAWPRRRQPPKAAPAPRAAAVNLPAAKIVPVRHRVVRHRRRRAPAAQPGPPLLVQFVTDDPNIVIYWLVDPKPQGE